VSRTEGFYFDTSARDGLKVSVSATIPQMAMGAPQAFYGWRFETRRRSVGAVGQLHCDINSGGNNHLTFNQLSGEAVNLGTLFTPKLNLTGKANLKLQAGHRLSGDPPAISFQRVARRCARTSICCGISIRRAASPATCRKRNSTTSASTLESVRRDAGAYWTGSTRSSRFCPSSDSE
jgi:hypothetical protein